jgi:formylglycine-generating enzyme required for sulfatase activity
MQARTLLALAAACVLSTAAGRAEEVKQEKATTPGPAEGQPWTVPDLGLELVPIQPGTFDMGSPPEEPGRQSNEDQHAVALTKPFWIGTYEVTQEEFEKIMGSNPSQFKAPRRPVEQVNWEDASLFCYKLTEREKKAGRLPAVYEYRLPTEAEWEYCCRAGSKSAYCFGGDAGSLGMYGWYDGNAGRTTHEVGQRKPNQWGICDMHGNVWEWCFDSGRVSNGLLITDTYRNGVSDPVCRQGSSRVFRGGSWYGVAASSRAADRRFLIDPLRYIHIGHLGFRVVLAAPVQ